MWVRMVPIIDFLTSLLRARHSRSCARSWPKLLRIVEKPPLLRASEVNLSAAAVVTAAWTTGIGVRFDSRCARNQWGSGKLRREPLGYPRAMIPIRFWTQEKICARVVAPCRHVALLNGDGATRTIATNLARVKVEALDEARIARAVKSVSAEFPSGSRPDP